MPKYVIEREIPGAAELFVSGDKIYCVYIAPNEEKLREHAQKGGFPINRISEVKMMIDPTTGGR